MSLGYRADWSSVNIILEKQNKIYSIEKEKNTFKLSNLN